jgi:hypothetical protein
MSSIAPAAPLSPQAARRDAPWSGTVRLIATTFMIVIITNVVHEAGHALAAKLLGYDALASINHVKLMPSVARSAADRLAIDLAGPAVTIGIAVIAWCAARRGALTIAPIVLFVALAMRLIAAVASLAAPNDEARASIILGLGKWTLFAIVISILLALFVSVYRRVGLGGRWLVGAYVGASLGFAAVVFGEPFLPTLSL